MIVHIEGADDPRLEGYRDIRDRTSRFRAGLFVGEGLLVVERMLARPAVTHSVLAAEGLAGRLAGRVPIDVPLFVAPMGVLRDTAGFDVHRGVLALGHRAPFEGRRPLEVLSEPSGPVCGLACEGITNADNVGLLFRNAAAFGVGAVVLDPTCHDPLYRRSLRVSIGHVLSVPWARATDWPRELEGLRDRCGLVLVAAATTPDAMPIDTLEPPERCLLVVGTEGSGLCDATLAVCDRVVRVPMAPGTDSLNVAVAAAVCLHRLCVLVEQIRRPNP